MNVSKLWQKLKSNGIDSITIILLLIIIIIIIFYVCIGMKTTPFSSYPNHTKSQRISRSLMRESLNDISSDRINHHMSRLPLTTATQSIAQSEGTKAYESIPGKIRHTYQMHTLFTNDNHEKTPITKELIKASKHVKGVSYHSNITTVSFGNKHYTKTQQQWHPWHKVITPHQMAKFINKRMIQGNKHNIHYRNILNKNNKSVGVYAKYNNKLNRGILVETFREKE